MKKIKLIKLMTVVLSTALVAGSLVGCGDSSSSSSSSKSSTSSSSSSASTSSSSTSTTTEKELVSVPQDDVVKSTKDLPIATIVVKDYGTMEVELYPEIAPNTVKNFISLANSGFYDGLTFHRIIDNFMIQGGDPAGNGTGGPGYSIKGEFSSNNFENKLLHKVGVISMARSMAPDSAGSQFFIMTADYPSLDGQYAAFGRTISGLDVLTKLKTVKTIDPTQGNDKPVKDVIIESIKVDTKGKEYPKPETTPDAK